MVLGKRGPYTVLGRIAGGEIDRLIRGFAAGRKIRVE